MSLKYIFVFQEQKNTSRLFNGINTGNGRTVRTTGTTTGNEGAEEEQSRLLLQLRDGLTQAPTRLLSWNKRTKTGPFISLIILQRSHNKLR